MDEFFRTLARLDREQLLAICQQNNITTQSDISEAIIRSDIKAEMARRYPGITIHENPITPFDQLIVLLGIEAGINIRHRMLHMHNDVPDRRRLKALGIYQEYMNSNEVLSAIVSLIYRNVIPPTKDLYYNKGSYAMRSEAELRSISPFIDETADEYAITHPIEDILDFQTIDTLQTIANRLPQGPISPCPIPMLCSGLYFRTRRGLIDFINNRPTGHNVARDICRTLHITYPNREVYLESTKGIIDLTSNIYIPEPWFEKDFLEIIILNADYIDKLYDKYREYLLPKLNSIKVIYNELLKSRYVQPNRTVTATELLTIVRQKSKQFLTSLSPRQVLNAIPVDIRRISTRNELLAKLQSI